MGKPFVGSENYPVVLFWDAPTWTVNLGIALLLLWPCHEPTPEIRKKESLF